MSDLLLEVVEGPGAGRQAPIAGPLEVGRDSSAGMVLEDDLVSRHHVRVIPEAGSALVEDLGSRNGTWVNGVRISSATHLAHGDDVRLGQTMLRVEGDEPARATATSAVAAADVVPFSAPAGRVRRAAATRLLGPMVAAYVVVAATAVALIVYFAAR